MEFLKLRKSKVGPDYGNALCCKWVWRGGGCTKSARREGGSWRDHQVDIRAAVTDVSPNLLGKL